MKKVISAFLCIPAAILLLTENTGAYNAAQVNAKAVSVQWRHGIGTDWSSMCCECWDGFPQGAIMVYTISNGAVQSNPAAIYTRDKGLATYPAFNLSGTKIAFFRSSKAPATSGNGCLTVNGGKSYVSVINTDGTGLTNLVEIPAAPSGEMLPLDWPAGDWIYYEKPYNIQNGDPTGVDIWRVNASSKAAEQVCNLSQGSTCTYWRRFSLTLKGDKMAGQTMGKYECSGGVGGGNCIWNFPVSGCNLSNGKGECRAACNISISPSGAVVGSYFSGAHTQLELGDNTPGVYSFGWGWGIDLFNQVAAWAGEDVGAGCELIRWAVNSDKWVLQNVGWYGHADAIAEGSNAVACDWIDKVAFNITKNPKLPSADANGVMHINSCTGDMWINDPTNNPSGNKYEDLSGVWHTVASTATGNEYSLLAEKKPAAIAMTPAGLLISIDPRSTSNISITDIKGRSIASRIVRGDALCVPRTLLTCGTYIVIVKSGNELLRRIVTQTGE
jgi:hypothetical protein